MLMSRTELQLGPCLALRQPGSGLMSMAPVTIEVHMGTQGVASHLRLSVHHATALAILIWVVMVTSRPELLPRAVYKTGEAQKCMSILS